MKRKLTPEDLQNSSEFELLTEVPHSGLKQFILKQIVEEKYIIRIYSVYQVLMILLLIFLFTRSIILAYNGFTHQLIGICLSALFSFSILIVVHEALHALAYLITGARKISFGHVPGKFIFYALADKQVINSRDFHFVALTPLAGIKLICLICFILYYRNPGAVYFFIGIMCWHSLFCAGDVSMLAFYRLNGEKEIFNFDSKTEGKTYFYSRKAKT